MTGEAVTDGEVSGEVRVLSGSDAEHAPRLPATTASVPMRLNRPNPAPQARPIHPRRTGAPAYLSPATISPRDHGRDGALASTICRLVNFAFATCVLLADGLWISPLLLGHRLPTRLVSADAVTV